MADLYHFWTHGVSIIPEKTKEFTGDHNGLFLQRAAWGARVRQNPGTDNWFHFAIPTPTILDGGSSVWTGDVWIRVKVNNGATVTGVRVHQTGGLNAASPVLFDAGPLNITGQDTQLTFHTPQSTTGPYVVSTHVQFENEGAEIVFGGVGGGFTG
ncbi:hypothetical protein ACFWBN_36615 [Streptomyces sp. NPDC059989]|uniref:hypothetical protein n=1 Tax=Streptomyces sp. NPDC059989 TaxID=3347026 RepID=UPI0036CDF633